MLNRYHLRIAAGQDKDYQIVRKNIELLLVFINITDARRLQERCEFCFVLYLKKRTFLR